MLVLLVASLLYLDLLDHRYLLEVDPFLCEEVGVVPSESCAHERQPGRVLPELLLPVDGREAEPAQAALVAEVSIPKRAGDGDGDDCKDDGDLAQEEEGEGRRDGRVSLGSARRV